MQLVALKFSVVSVLLSAMALFEGESEYLAPEDDIPVPKPLDEFLEHNFKITDFQARKEDYIVLINTKENDYLRHLQESYTLINFWQFLFLGLNTEFKSIVGSEKVASGILKVLQNYAQRHPTKSGRQANYWTMDPSTVCKTFSAKPRKSDEELNSSDEQDVESTRDFEAHNRDISTLSDDSHEVDVRFSPAIGRSVETYSNVKLRETVVKLEQKDSLETDFVTCKWELNERKFGLNRPEEDARNVGIYGDLDFKSPMTQAGAAAEDDQKDKQSDEGSNDQGCNDNIPVKSIPEGLIVGSDATEFVKPKTRKRKNDQGTTDNPSLSRRKCRRTLKVKMIDPQPRNIDPEQSNQQIVKKRRNYPKNIQRKNEGEFVKQNDAFYKSSLYHKVQTEKRRQFFENGVLKDYSVEALYRLQREKDAENSRRLRNKLSRNVNCQVCDKKLGRRAWNHVFICHGLDYRNTCAICLKKDLSEILDQPDNLMAHFRKEHFKDLEMRCNICPLVFYSAKELHTHILTHDGVKSLKGEFLRCPVCSFPFSSKDALDDHLAIHAKSVKAKLKLPENKPKVSGTCEICGHLVHSNASSTLQAKIRSHVAQVHKQEKPYKCHLCPKEFKNIQAVSKHHTSMHTPDNVRPYICTVDNCNKTFKMRSNLSQHQKYHQPPRFKCERCLKEFYWKTVLNSHKCPALFRK